MQLDLNTVREILIYPSLLMEYYWADSENLNQALKTQILQVEERETGVITTNVGGWHSKKNLQSWGGSEIDAVLERIRMLGAVYLSKTNAISECELGDEWRIQAWANVNRTNNHNKFHAHVRNQNLLSGIYYVSAGEGDSGEFARTVFVDQHQLYRKDIPDRDRLYFDPLPGLMLMFPSSLGHRVEVQRNAGERITIAFNIKNDRFSTIYYDIEASKDGQ